VHLGDSVHRASESSVKEDVSVGVAMVLAVRITDGDIGVHVSYARKPDGADARHVKHCPAEVSRVPGNVLIHVVRVVGDEHDRLNAESA